MAGFKTRKRSAKASELETTETTTQAQAAIFRTERLPDGSKKLVFKGVTTGRTPKRRATTEPVFSKPLELKEKTTKNEDKSAQDKVSNLADMLHVDIPETDSEHEMLEHFPYAPPLSSYTKRQIDQARLPKGLPDILKRQLLKLGPRPEPTGDDKQDRIKKNRWHTFRRLIIETDLAEEAKKEAELIRQAKIINKKHEEQTRKALAERMAGIFKERPLEEAMNLPVSNTGPAIPEGNEPPPFEADFVHVAPAPPPTPRTSAPIHRTNLEIENMSEEEQLAYAIALSRS